MDGGTASHVSYLAVLAYTGVCSPSAIIRLGNQYNLNNLLLAHNSSRRRLMPSNLSTTYFRVAARRQQQQKLKIEIRVSCDRTEADDPAAALCLVAKGISARFGRTQLPSTEPMGVHRYTRRRRRRWS